MGAAVGGGIHHLHCRDAVPTGAAPRPRHDPVTAPELEPAAVAAAMASGELSVVDVREPVEWDSGHIAGSLLIPLGEFADRVGELPDGPLAIVCRSGSRSSMAADWLHRSGVP